LKGVRQYEHNIPDIITAAGMDWKGNRMSEDNALLLKKLTLKAWTNHFFSKGMISFEKQQKMIEAIERLRS
jgi:hypothetical protein